MRDAGGFARVRPIMHRFHEYTLGYAPVPRAEQRAARGARDR